MVRQPHIDVPRAVGQRGVGGAALAVHGDIQRTLGSIGLGISGKRSRHRPRRQHHQRLIVSEAIEREIRDLGGVQLGADVGFVRLQELGLRLDGDDLVDGTHLQRHLDAADLPDGHRHSRSHRFAEPGQCDLHIVGAGRRRWRR